MAERSLRSMLKPALYLVATPIGNLGDLPPRAAEVLSAAHRVYAEDTRHTQKLFNHFDIHTELRSLHQHNEASRASEIQQSILNGEAIALVTDAGTPGISDPGSTIVNVLLEAKVTVCPVPGASSLSAALSVSGFDHGEFGTLWFGFLPQKRKARRDTLAKFERFPGVVVFLESPHRVEACADDLSDLFGDRELVVCRELTKKYETVYRTTCKAFPSLSKEAARGELTLVLGPGAAKVDSDEDEALEALYKLLDAGFSAKDASKAASILFDIPKKILYTAAIAKKG